MRGSLIGDEDAAVLRTRTPRTARALARVLNGDTALPKSGAARSPLPRYTVFEVMNTGEWVVNSSGTSQRRPGAFGEGPVALTGNKTLAQRVAQALNSADPAPVARWRYGVF